MTDTALIVSATPPVPVDSGKRLFLNGLLNYFVERLGESCVHYAVICGPDESLPSFPGVVHRVARSGAAAQLKTLARCVTDRHYTAQEAMLGSAAIAEQIKAVTQQVRPTVEVYDTLRLGQHAPARPRARRRVLYLDDLFSERYDRMLRFAAENDDVTFDPLGEFAANVPAPLRGLVRHDGVYRRILRMERDRLRYREAEVVHAFDVSVLVNENEIEVLRSRSGSPSIELIHDLLPALPPPVREPAHPPELVFLGRLNLPHNDEAVCTFVRDVMPEVERLLPGVRLRIAGKGATDRLRRLVNRHPDSIVLEGFVPDLQALFARATVSVVPLRMGSGIKIKMLDALARGLPVLSTSIGVDGIPVDRNGSDGCLVENDFSKWPELIRDLVDSGLGRELSDAGRAFFERTYGRRVVMGQYDRIFGLGDRSDQNPRSAGTTPPYMDAGVGADS